VSKIEAIFESRSTSTSSLKDGIINMSDGSLVVSFYKKPNAFNFTNCLTYPKTPKLSSLTGFSMVQSLRLSIGFYFIGYLVVKERCLFVDTETTWGDILSNLTFPVELIFQRNLILVSPLLAQGALREGRTSKATYKISNKMKLYLLDKFWDSGCKMNVDTVMRDIMVKFDSPKAQQTVDQVERFNKKLNNMKKEYCYLSREQMGKHSYFVSAADAIRSGENQEMSEEEEEENSSDIDEGD